MPDSADQAFVSAAGETLDGLLERRPEWATELGDHRHDGKLTAGTAAHHEEVARWCGDRLAALRAIDPGRLSAQNRVDAQILDGRLRLIIFGTNELREHEWNPMAANPGRAIYLLLARDFAPLPERLRAVAQRLAAVPETLAAARGVARSMPRVHIETALGQFAGTARLIGAE